MQCVKLLLSCSFCANSADRDLALTLQRKLSTHSQGESQAKEDSPESIDKLGKSAVSASTQAANKLIADWESTLDEMAPLIELL